MALRTESALLVNPSLPQDEEFLYAKCDGVKDRGRVVLWCSLRLLRNECIANSSRSINLRRGTSPVDRLAQLRVDGSCHCTR